MAHAPAFPAVIRLGADLAACRAGLEHYERRVDALDAACRGGDADTVERLAADLRFELEVDVVARRSPSGRARLAAAESFVLAPTLEHLLECTRRWQGPVPNRYELGLLLEALRDARWTLDAVPSAADAVHWLLMDPVFVA